MSVGVGALGPLVDRHVSDQAMVNETLLDPGGNKPPLGLGVELARQRDVVFLGYLGVLSLLTGLHCVP